MLLQQWPSSFPASSWFPAGVLDALLFAQDLLSCDLPWVEQTLEKTAGTGCSCKAGVGEKKGNVFSPKEALRGGPVLWRTCVVLSMGDFGIVPPFPAVPHSLQCTPGGMDVPAAENVVAPSPVQHEACDTQASALLCKATRKQTLGWFLEAGEFLPMPGCKPDQSLHCPSVFSPGATCGVCSFPSLNGAFESCTSQAEEVRNLHFYGSHP
ncbi:uncharacterized protein LOC119702896 [Motacilla alba alba]|uniref:uncharacterized protein LOC119702896 n=1 Tax=Motacilla alba alba TaxID=1094192 RepID=UPI0018D519D2|nr:uncharacterized protein LOC119702896 [Motacilla alba alba]